MGISRKLLLVSVTVLVIGNQSVVASTAKLGGSCTKVGQIQQTGNTLLTCAFKSNKKVWRVATSAEKSKYLKSKTSLDQAAATKLIENAKIEAQRILDEAKAAAEKTAAEAAAAKVISDKAAADKAAADAAAKAAADKAAADAAARAANEVPNLSVGRVFSGVNADNQNWKWVAVQVTNTSSTKIYSHRFFNVILADSTGGIIDTSFEPSFPLLAPGQTIWYVTTQFKPGTTAQVVFQKQYTTGASPFAPSELPTVSNPHLINSPFISGKKSIAFTLKNNSASQIISKSSTGYAVIFDATGNPAYVARGFFDKAILPGGSSEITIGDDFTFNGQVTSIQITTGVLVG